MLKHLWIKDYIIMDEISLDFRTGMSAFTGETGAGKSILIDALAILCGARTSGSVVRTGKETAIIEGVFTINRKESLQILQHAGIALEDEYIITREINREGKSTARINHRVVNVGLLKQLLDGVVDIHNQRDSQYLLDPKVHIHLLDRYHGNYDLVSKTESLYKEYATLAKELETAINTELNESELEFLQYQIQEIESLNIVVGELEQLENRQKQMMSFEKINQVLNETDQRFLEQGGVVENLYHVMNLFAGSDIEEFVSFHDRVSSLYFETKDIADTVHNFHAQLEFDEVELNTIQERIFMLYRLIRKHGSSEIDVLKALDTMQEKIKIIENRQAYIEQAEKKVQEAQARFLVTAQELHQLRVESSTKLAEEVMLHLADLELQHAIFEIQITETTARSVGIDDVSFLISMNKGETTKPLVQVASGGELSRLMLGLKTIFSQLQGIETVVFDEIDTGVSGKIATMIGVKMRTLAKNIQVFSVTHLAQVAACSEYHYFVAKDQSGESTKTNVYDLSTSQRIQQLSLIASGTTTPAALESAKELLFSCQNMVREL